MKKERTCATCVFYNRFLADTPGGCRRNMPVAGLLDAERSENYWCGEHRTEAEFESERAVIFSTPRELKPGEPDGYLAMEQVSELLAHRRKLAVALAYLCAVVREQRHPGSGVVAIQNLGVSLQAAQSLERKVSIQGTPEIGATMLLAFLDTGKLPEVEEKP